MSSDSTELLARRSFAEDLLWLAATIILILSFGFLIRSNADLWWHITAGREILETGLSYTNTWSYTEPNAPWLNHEWLADVIYALWVQTFSLASLIYWKWLMLLAIYISFYYALSFISTNRALCFIAIATALLLSEPYLDFRPHLYSLLGITLFLLLYYRTKLWTIWTPLLFLVWANLHAGVLLGLIFLGGFLLYEKYFEGNTEKTLWHITAFSLLAALCNPNGYALLLYPLDYMFQANEGFSSLNEWQSPIRALHGRALYLYAITACSGFILYVRQVMKGESLFEAGAFMVVLFMSLRSQRFIPFFAILFAILLVKESATVQFPKSIRLNLGLALSCLAIATYSALQFPLDLRAFNYMVHRERAPNGACDFLEKHSIRGNIFTDYVSASYLHFCSGGKLKVFIDGRADTAYSPATFARYLQIKRMEHGWLDELQSSNTEYVLWRTKGRLVPFLKQSKDWTVLYEDGNFVLFHPIEKTLPVDEDSSHSVNQLVALDHALHLALNEKLEKAHELLAPLQHQPLPPPGACVLYAKVLAYQGKFRESTRHFEQCKDHYPLLTRIQEINRLKGIIERLEPAFGKIPLPPIHSL